MEEYSTTTWGPAKVWLLLQLGTGTTREHSSAQRHRQAQQVQQIDITQTPTMHKQVKQNTQNNPHILRFLSS